LNNCHGGTIPTAVSGRPCVSGERPQVEVDRNCLRDGGGSRCITTSCVATGGGQWSPTAVIGGPSCEPCVAVSCAGRFGRGTQTCRNPGTGAVFRRGCVAPCN
jgi:hypothetical protein